MAKKKDSKKGYLTILFLLIGGYAVARLLKKPKAYTIPGNPILQPYAKKGSTVYEYDLTTPIFTFKKEIVLTILQQDPDLPYTKVSFTANNMVKTGWINDNDITKL
jgi:hypothetical protein